MLKCDRTIARSWAEIDLAALSANLETGREGKPVMAIVKANAYGHGAIECARALDEKITMLGVAGVREAQELVEAGVKSPLFLLGASLPTEREPAVKGGYRISVSSLEEARCFSDIAVKCGKPAYCHLSLDTGMGRIGFLPSTWTKETIQSLLALPGVVIEGIASHYPSADEDEEFTKKQTQRFLDAVDQARAWGLDPEWIHIANSAGSMGHYCKSANLSRLGLLLYGASPLPELQSDLQPVMALKSRVTMIRHLPKGTQISYGGTYQCPKDQTVATISIGYGDGYPRSLSGTEAKVLIHGQRCSILGRVTMDQIMVNVSELPVVEIGDEVVLIGKQGDDEISVTEVADWAATIPWEIFTGITPRVVRSYQNNP